MTQRYALGIEYDGTGFMGWQRLKHGPSIQREVELALSKIANHDIVIYCAGRTDSGVHAISQVVHFDTDASRPDHAWVLGANAQLDDRICIQWAQKVPDDFHARFNAEYRSYRYIILNRKTKPALMRNQLAWINKPLNEQQMHIAAQTLLGENDFSSFRASGCQAKSPIKTIKEIRWHRQGDFVILDIVANAFLYHMVRNIVGSCIKVGLGEQNSTWLAELLSLKNRQYAPATAVAKGLYFIHAGYPAHFGLPNAKNPDQILWPDSGK